MLEYRVPKTAKQTTCRTCGAAIVFTTTASGGSRGRPVALDLASARKDFTGERAALDHRSVCTGRRPAKASTPISASTMASGVTWPATWVFPAGALEPLANPASRVDGELRVTFADRWAMYDCLVVTGFARARKLVVTLAESGAPGVTLVVME